MPGRTRAENQSHRSTKAMNQSPYFMEVHANYKMNDIAREMAHADAMKQLRAYKSSARSADAPVVDRSLPTVDVAGFSRALGFFVRGWKLTLRGRAVA